MVRRDRLFVLWACFGAGGPMSDQANVRPFSCGTDSHDWRWANCDRCTKNGPFDPATGAGPCPMETAIARGAILGTIPADLAVEYGATVEGESCTMPTQCPQFAPTTTCEALADRRRKHSPKCGKPATDTFTTERGYRRAVCASCKAKVSRASALAGAR